MSYPRDADETLTTHEDTKLEAWRRRALEAEEALVRLSCRLQVIEAERDYLAVRPWLRPGGAL